MQQQRQEEASFGHLCLQPYLILVVLRKNPLIPSFPLPHTYFLNAFFHHRKDIGV